MSFSLNKIARIAILLLVSAIPIMAQNVTVTGTITDTDGTIYAGGLLTVSLVNTSGQVATFGGSPSFQKVYSLTLDSTGSFSISLPPNSTASPSIQPAGTQWNFAYASQGGYGAANANVTITGTGSISGFLSGLTEITFPSPVPPCSTGQLVIAISTTQSECGTSTDIAGAGANVIYAGGPPYSALFDVLKYFDATWNGSTTTVTISGTDTPFTPSLTGKKCFGMPGLASGPGAYGTFAYLTATTGTCSPIAALISTASSNGAFAVGDDDTAALQSATAAAYALCKQGSTLVLPAGSTFVSSGIGGNGGTGCAQQSPPGTISSGFSVIGQGYTSTYIIPGPGFSFSTSGSSGAGCNSGSIPGCFWNNSNVNATYENFTIDGFGQNGAGITTGLNALFTMGANSLAINVDLFNWFTTPSVGTAGCQITGSGAYGIGLSCQNFGTTSENLLCSTPLPNFAILSSSSVTSTLQIANNAGCQDNQGTYLGLFNNGGIFWGRGTQTLAQASGSTASTQLSGCSQQNCGNDYLQDCYIAKGSNGSGTTGLIINASTTVVARGCIFNGGSTGGSVSGSGTFIDQCGNTFLQPFTSWTGFYIPCPTSTPPGGINTPTITGTGACASPSTKLGTMFYGSAVCPGTTGASTFVITPGVTAANGWNCQGTYDKTTYAVPTALTYTTTACTATFTSVTANDIISFKIQQF